jgi:hypothetical protein
VNAAGGLPVDELYRQLFNPQLYLLAYGRIYSNHGAMTAGVTGETVDAMSLGKIGRIIDALRHERYRFNPVRRVWIPKKNGKLRPLGLPTWSDKLVGEVVRLLLEAYYEPTFSDRSHGFRPGRGCHTATRRLERAGGQGQVCWTCRPGPRWRDGFDRQCRVTLPRESTVHTTSAATDPHAQCYLPDHQRFVQCVHTRPYARQWTALTATPPASLPSTRSRGGACCATA